VVTDEIAYHDEVNNEVKIVLEDVNAIELKDVQLFQTMSVKFNLKASIILLKTMKMKKK
jgi:hypothetical protein